MSSMSKRYHSFMISDILDQEDEDESYHHHDNHSIVTEQLNKSSPNCVLNGVSQANCLMDLHETLTDGGHSLDTVYSNSISNGFDPFHEKFSPEEVLKDPRYAHIWFQISLRRKMMLQSKPRKGGQIRFTHQQTIMLEKKFDQYHYLTPSDRKSLADQLNLSERQVKTWFQNRRAKYRRTKEPSYPNESHSKMDNYFHPWSEDEESRVKLFSQ